MGLVILISKQVSRSVVPLLTIGMLLTGCGGESDDSTRPVYDTAANPDNFPPAACDLLIRVENRDLTSLDSISIAFADLYTEHSDLLDNEQWHIIIERLGARFLRYGREEVARGVAHYRQAADYFQLAQFARQLDPESLELSRLFAVWREIEDSALAAWTIADSVGLAQMSWPERIELVQYFIFGDSLHQAFARQYLIDPLVADHLAIQSATDLSEVERAFLASLGMPEVAVPDKVLASFGNGAVDLIACRVRELGADAYRAECYFVPTEKLDADFHIALWLPPPGQPAHSVSAVPGYFTADHTPNPPTSAWTVGRVVAVGWPFIYLGIVEQFDLGLYSIVDGDAVFAPVTGSADSLVSLPAAPSYP